MKLQPSPSKRPLWALLVLSSAMAGSSAWAASETGPTKTHQLDPRDVAACRATPEGTDKAACLHEARAVRASREAPSVQSDPGRLARNALKRCEPLAGSDRSECVARIQGQGSTSGSVAGGDILRELVTREIPPMTTPPAADPAASAPN